MKKRVLSVLLAIVMVVGMFPVTAGALPAPHTHPVCGKTHTDIGDHTGTCEAVKWTAWNGTTDITYTDGTAYVYLSADVSLSGALVVGANQTLYLCLNDHVLDYNGNSASGAITVRDGGVLYLTDCCTAPTTRYGRWNEANTVYTISTSQPDGGSFDTLMGGVITGGGFSANLSSQTYNGGGVWVYNGTFYMYGGTIAGNTAFGPGGGVYVTNGADGAYGVFYLYDGTITGNRAANGGGLGVFQGEFYMSGGEITGNTATGSTGGGGVYVSESEFYMSGGSITDNRATANGGGVVLSYSNKSKFNMSGGSITGNSAGTNGGGVYAPSSAYITVSGAPKIINNTKGTGDSAPANNLVPESYLRFTVSGTLGTGASIGIFRTAAGRFSAGGADSVSYFSSDNAGYKVEASGKNLTLVSVAVPVTDVSLSESSLTLDVGGTKTLTATVLPDDATDKTVIWTSSDNNVATVENGKVTALTPGSTTITATTTDGGFTATCAVTVSAPAETHKHDMSVDCGGSGVTFEPWDGTTTFPGGNVYLTDDITLTEELTISGTVNLCLNGHSITNSATAAIAVNSGATLNICDCKGGGSVTNSGGTTYGIYNSGTVNVYGGTISATTAATTTTAGSGSGIYNYSGQVTVVGTGAVVSGTFYGIYNNSTNGTVSVSAGKVSGKYGIYNKGKVIVGGEITVTGTDYGISNSGTVSISGGTVQATGSNGHGIYSTGGTVSVSGGIVQATGSNGRGISVSGGTVSVSDGTVSGLTYGVYASSTGDITISGGEVSARNSASNSNSYGVYRLGSGAVEITGGTVSGKHGVYLYGSGNVTVSGGTVTGNGSSIYGYGIYLHSSSTGAVSVSGGTVSGTAYGVYTTGNSSGSVTVSGVANISGAQSGILHYGKGTVTVSGGTVQSPQRVTGTTSSGIKILTGSGNVTVSGGTVSGMDYGIYNGGTLTLSNAPTITGDTADIHLDSGKIITISGALTYTEENAISVKMDSAGTFTSGWTTKMGENADNYGSYFTSKNEGYTVQPDSGELKIAEPPATETHSHDMSVECGGSGVTFEPWDGTTTFPGGNVYLTKDVTLAETLTISSGTVNLCLNGHVLKYDGTDKVSVIKVASNATLSICDCTNTTHTGYINSDGLWEAGTPSGEEAAVTLTGGIITGGTGYRFYDDTSYYRYGGGIYVDGGTLNLYGGNIAGNLCAHEGDLKKYGGGGVYVKNGTFNMYDGTITGNCAMTKTNGGGGGLYLDNSTFNMSGGKISQNKAHLVSGSYGGYGGGIYVFGSNSQANLSGTAEISGNSAYSAGGGINLATGSITMSGNVAIDGNEAQNGGGVSFKGNTFTINGGSISNNTATGSYGAGGVEMTSGSITMNDGSISNNTAAGTGGGVRVYDGTFTMAGGSISGNKTTGSAHGGGVYIYNNGSATFAMTAGKISGNTASGNGGGVYNDKVFQISGGEISGNIASVDGGGVYANKAVKLSGAPTISGNTVNENSNNVSVSTSVNIAVVGELTNTTPIGVTVRSSGTGKFASPSSDVATLANGYADKFQSDNPAYAIAVDGNNLKLVVLHTHNYTYSATGNIITESCTCGHKETATLELNTTVSAVYTGSAIKALKVTYSSGWVGDKNAEISYTNNTNVGTASGSVTIGGLTVTKSFTITKKSAEAPAAPTAQNSITYGAELSEVGLTAGWTWADGNTIPTVNNSGYTAYYTPADVTNLDWTAVDGWNASAGRVERTVAVTVNKSAPTYTAPTGLTATYGDTLANVSLPSGWTWKTPSASVGNAGVNSFKAVFTPDDTDNYDTVEIDVIVTVGKADASYTTPTGLTATYGDTLADVSLPSGWTWKTPSASVGNVGINSFKAVYTPSDTDNFNAAEVDVSVTVGKANSSYTAPTAKELVYSGSAQTLVNAGSTTTGAMQYALGSITEPTGSWSATLPQGQNAGTYYIWYKVVGDDNHNDVAPACVAVTIAKADQIAPTGLTKADTTYFGKADGKIFGLTSAMEFRKEGDSAYTAGFNGTLEYLEAGTYYVRYQGDVNHNPSPDTAFSVSEGRKLNIIVPQNPIGYTVTVNKTEMEYEGSYTLKVEINEGYTATEDFKIIISSWACGQQAGVEETYRNAIADQIIEVQGVADITAPAAKIEVAENGWTTFLNTITFGQFFKENQNVTISATDLGSGVNSIEYYIANGEMTLDAVKAITAWEGYNGTFRINPDNQYVIYAKVTDNAGNITYISSDGLVLDATAPALFGIENNGVYYGDKIFKAIDDHFLKIEIDGIDVTDTTQGDDEYKVTADNAEHTVTVTDKAGNVTEYKITVYKNYTVTFKVDGATVDTQTVGYGKDATAPSIPAKEGYTQTAPAWDKDGKNITADTEINAVYTINEYTITFMDENGVYKTLTYKHGEAVTMPEAPAKDGYTVTWDTTIEKATGNATVNAVYTKNAVSDNPQTGDNSNLWLWWILLIVSAASITVLCIEQKKRRATK